VSDMVLVSLPRNVAEQASVLARHEAENGSKDSCDSDCIICALNRAAAAELEAALDADPSVLEEQIVEAIAERLARIGAEEFNGPGDADEFREDAVKVARAVLRAITGEEER